MLLMASQDYESQHKSWMLCLQRLSGVVTVWSQKRGMTTPRTTRNKRVTCISVSAKVCCLKYTLEETIFLIKIFKAELCIHTQTTPAPWNTIAKS